MSFRISEEVKNMIKRIEEDDIDIGEICPGCNREIQVGDNVNLVRTSQRRGDIEFNVDYIPYHVGCL